MWSWSKTKDFETGSPSRPFDLDHCLFLDLEVSSTNEPFQAGLVLGQKEFLWDAKAGKTKLENTFREWAPRACALVGHNLWNFDLPRLQNWIRSVGRISLPVIDTLYLSPICFPENPYHRLVKDYKLVSVARNNPVQDAKCARELFRDEVAVLTRLVQAAPDYFTALWSLLAPPQNQQSALEQGIGLLFKALAKNLRPLTPQALMPLLQKLLLPHACATAIRKLDDTDLGTQDRRWAVAFALAWLRVAGGNSVLPPWVRIQFPLTVTLLDRLRDTCCFESDCSYCREAHSPENMLRRFFGFESFRPQPATERGESLQRVIVGAVMRGQPVLAVMPTGAGKSLCFQLPALVRYYRRGLLTIVISPLQALMIDQVDRLRRSTGLHCTGAIHGQLNILERAQILRETKMGDIGLLYLSPEQLRSSSVVEAISSREIAGWVIDEAHCLSAWGHDFRPDYLYVARIIRELARSQGNRIPPVFCFTATARREVISEITTYFQRELGISLTVYESSPSRANLHFEVLPSHQSSKLPLLANLLAERLASTDAAIVYRATRRLTQETAEFLRRHGWRCAAYHAGMPPPIRRQIQDDFIQGRLQIICATSAFGMGVDKKDIRLVIHADLPPSLEDYLQEAGRAGRDGNPAFCVLLYDEEDCEQQFRILAQTQLTRNEIQRIWRSIRNVSQRRRSKEIVITPGEIVRSIAPISIAELNNALAETKVRTAIAWLERAGLLERKENVTSVLHLRPRVPSVQEAEELLRKLDLPERERSLWVTILTELLNSPPDELVSIDMLASLPAFRSFVESSADESAEESNGDSRLQFDEATRKVLRTLDAMVTARILSKGTNFSAYIRHRVASHSQQRLHQIIALDRLLLETVMQAAPDAEGWLVANARILNTVLQSQAPFCSLELIHNLLRIHARAYRGLWKGIPPLELLYVGGDSYRVRIRHSWAEVRKLMETRHLLLQALLQALYECIPAGAPASASLLVEFSFEQMMAAVEKNLALRGMLEDVQRAVETGLLVLHELDVIVLQKGLAIFRQAYTLHLSEHPEKGRATYTEEDYTPLKLFYGERILKIHVMSEYAKLATHSIERALTFVLDYFQTDSRTFLQRHFGEKQKWLEVATTRKYYDAIVQNLNHPTQQQIVTAPPETNLLILAGPGSGKTRVVVHRAAWLLKVKRVPAHTILICCFNRWAAQEVRRRLAELVGPEARGVTVATYHSLALRLLGLSPKVLADDRSLDSQLNELVVRAAQVLRGIGGPADIDPDEQRDRLLRGFEYILVDEYQDIDEPQYDLISALAGRTLSDRERRLAIMAVGDDDQSIYGFRGANVEFIRRFQRDYEAQVIYLVDNFRSTRHIIEAANRLIAHNQDRMKKGHPIRIDSARRYQPRGGPWANDPVTQGKVSLIPVADKREQAVAVVNEIQRLLSNGIQPASSIAVLSRNWEDLAAVRSVAESRNTCVAWPLDSAKMPALCRVREIRRFLDLLEAHRTEVKKPSEWIALLGPTDGATNPWLQLLSQILTAWQEECDDDPVCTELTIEYLYNDLLQRRRDERFGEGVVLSTVHGAKGTEFSHVLVCGDWSLRNGESLEEQRRLLYVAMTRARETLAIFLRKDRSCPFEQELSGACFVRRRPSEGQTGTFPPLHTYELWGPTDIFLDFAGRYPPTHPIHAALAETRTSDILEPVETDRGIELISRKSKATIARLSQAAAERWVSRTKDIREVHVVAMVQRTKDDVTDAEFRAHVAADRWEYPICEVVLKET